MLPSALVLLAISLLLLSTSSLAFSPRMFYYINCGSSVGASLVNRNFQPDGTSLDGLSSNLDQSTALLDPSPSKNLSDVYASARVFSGACWYAFDVPASSTLFLRLHFLPFTSSDVDLRIASLRVSAAAGSLLLLRNFVVSGSAAPTVKEFVFWFDENRLNLTFTPADGVARAFVSAIELFTAPDNFSNITVARPVGGARAAASNRQAAATLFRVNAGGPAVAADDDLLWRPWVNDSPYLPANGVLARASSTNKTIRFATALSGNISTEEVAPAAVYRTLQEINTGQLTVISLNVTWVLPVSGGYQHLIRLHFCDFVSSSVGLDFNVFVNNQSGYPNLRPSTVTAGAGVANTSVGCVPFFLDFLTDVSDSITISVGTTDSDSDAGKNAILNGFEVLRLNNSDGSLDGGSPGVSPSKSSTNLAVIIAPVAAAAVLAALLALYLVYRRRKVAPRPAVELTETGSAWTSVPGVGTQTTSAGSAAAWGPLSVSPVGLQISLAEIRRATNGFDEKLVIGSGGFGKVYRGELANGTVVAVKCASPTSRQGFPEFQNEIMVLSQIRHRHLVALVGYCDEDNEMILVYEYMSRGPLKDLLLRSPEPLTWTQRLEVCIGATRGLHYLHTGFTHSIIHRDVKSSNILLGDDYVAKVADFGLSRLGPSLDETHVSTAVKGSFGYMDPEYFRTQKLTHKSDVYSLGVVLFEVLCGRPVINPQLPRDEMNLAEWASRKVREGRGGEIVDARMAGVVGPRSLRKFAEAADKCLAERGEDRPAIGDVLWSLEYALQLQKSEERGVDNSVTDVTASDAALLAVPGGRWEAMASAAVSGDGDLDGSNIFSQLITGEGR